MRKVETWKKVILVIAIAAVSLTGCGSSGSSSSDDEVVWRTYTSSAASFSMDYLSDWDMDTDKDDGYRAVTFSKEDTQVKVSWFEDWTTEELYETILEQYESLLTITDLPLEDALLSEAVYASEIENEDEFGEIYILEGSSGTDVYWIFWEAANDQEEVDEIVAECQEMIQTFQIDVEEDTEETAADTAADTEAET